MDRFYIKIFRGYCFHLGTATGFTFPIALVHSLQLDITDDEPRYQPYNIKLERNKIISERFIFMGVNLNVKKPI